jgi:DNA-binding MarR family transcriptional regulator
MGSILQKRLKQTAPFDNPGDEAMVNVLITADYLRAAFDEILSLYDITQSQYNILRILKGVYPEGHPRGEISCRMIERAPDCTRLLDGLERKGLVERVRIPEDKRLSVARITEQGIVLLAKITPHTKTAMAGILQRVSVEECLALSRLCEKLYDEGAHSEQ